MERDQYYFLLTSIMVLVDIVIWLRVVRLPRGRRAPQIFGGILGAIAIVLTLNLWIMGRR